MSCDKFHKLVKQYVKNWRFLSKTLTGHPLALFLNQLKCSRPSKPIALSNRKFQDHLPGRIAIFFSPWQVWKSSTRQGYQHLVAAALQASLVKQGLNNCLHRTGIIWETVKTCLILQKLQHIINHNMELPLSLFQGPLEHELEWSCEKKRCKGKKRTAQDREMDSAPFYFSWKYKRLTFWNWTVLPLLHRNSSQSHCQTVVPEMYHICPLLEWPLCLWKALAPNPESLFWAEMIKQGWIGIALIPTLHFIWIKVHSIILF